MTRMTVTLDETVLEEAKNLLHTHTKRETIETGSRVRAKRRLE